MVDVIHHLFGSSAPFALGIALVGDASAPSNDVYRPLTSDGRSLVLGRKGSDKNALHLTAQVMDIAPVYMHGKEYHWIAIYTTDMPRKYVRLDPMTDKLSLTSLFDSTCRWLAATDKIHGSLARLSLHGTAYGMHSTRTPLHSITGLYPSSDGSVAVVPIGPQTTFLYLLNE